MVIELINYDSAYKFGGTKHESTLIVKDVTDDEFYVCLLDMDSTPSSEEFNRIAKRGNFYNLEGEMSFIDKELMDTFNMGTEDMIKEVGKNQILFVKTWNIPEGIDIFLF